MIGRKILPLLLLGAVATWLPAAPTTQTFAARGVVQRLAADHRSATIQHEAIPGYMSAMTMDFNVPATNLLAGIAEGDEVTFNLVVRGDDDWIEQIQRTGKSVAPTLPAWHAVEPELAVGDLLPDAELLTETGDRVRFADYRGRALAFTFFFTSCPLPDFCPRMNRNLAEARRLLLADTNMPGNWQFLSVSFDPTIDQPAILASYAQLYRGADTNRWLFAVASSNTLARLAPRLDLLVLREGGSITHNLRTVVLDPQGRIHHQFDGNDWTPAELARAVRDAATNVKP